MEREERGYREDKATVYLISLLLWPAGYITLW
jgi:hypothetical protein